MTFDSKNLQNTTMDHLIKGSITIYGPGDFFSSELVSFNISKKIIIQSNFVCKQCNCMFLAEKTLFLRCGYMKQHSQLDPARKLRLSLIQWAASKLAFLLCCQRGENPQNYLIIIIIFSLSQTFQKHSVCISIQ